MAEVDLELEPLGVHDLMVIANRLAEGLDGNPNFPDAAPLQAAITSALENLRAKQEEYRALRQRVNDLKMERASIADSLRAAVNQGASHVQEASGGDPSKILSANLPIEHRIDFWPFNDPREVHELSASAGDSPGEIDLAWDSVRGAAGYEIELCSDFYPPEKWKPRATTAGSKITIDNLEPRRRYWFRIRALSEKGRGDWCDPVMKYAP